jgi:hypothetical protein
MLRLNRLGELKKFNYPGEIMEKYSIISPGIEPANIIFNIHI